MPAWRRGELRKSAQFVAKRLPPVGKTHKKQHD